MTNKNYSGPGGCDSTPDVIYTYDTGTNGIGRRTGMTDGSGVTAWTYDERGRKLSEIKVIDNQTFNMAWSYNKADLPVTMTYPDGEVVNLTYNDQGLLDGMSNTGGFTYIRGLGYDEAGRMTGLGLGETGSLAVIQRNYTYHEWSDDVEGGLLDNLNSVSQSATLQSLAYEYDRNGNITDIVDGVTTESSAFSYDGLDRLTGMTVTDGGMTVHEEAFTYDEAGRMDSKDGNSFSYDGGHPHAVSGLDGNTYLYDENGNQVSRSLPEGIYSLVYDGENRLVEVTTNIQLAPTATATPTETATPDGTPTETETPTEEVTLELTPTETVTPEFTPTETLTPTDTVTPTEEPTLGGMLPVGKALAALKQQEDTTDTPTPTETPTPTATATEIILPTDTETPTETATNTPMVTQTATQEFTPTDTESLVDPWSEAEGTTDTSTPTMTETPSVTPTPTATGIPTEPTPEPLQSAYYVYDGDNNLVKSIINGKSTYYLGKLYQKKIDGETVTVQKYYSSGSAQIAVRTIQGESDTLQWLLSDHLGSTSTTANADGTWNSTISYTAFGEIRTSSGITPTEFRYTGQLRQAELGLYYYVARWYDPYLNHFVQADTLVPNAGDSAAYDRFAYVRNNPIKYNDPSGHKACDGEYFDACGRTTGSSIATEKKITSIADNYNIYITGLKWNLSQVSKVNKALIAMDKGITKIAGNGKEWIKKNLGGTKIDTGDRIGKLLNSAYAPDKKNTHLPENFEKAAWPSAINHTVENMIIHEFGHTFDNRLGNQLLPAVFGGGGSSDQLQLFMGSNMISPIRFMGGVNLEAKYLFGKEDGFRYGNNSPADYFAHAFTAALVGPTNQNAPERAVSWVSALIYLTR